MMHTVPETPPDMPLHRHGSGENGMSSYEYGCRTTGVMLQVKRQSRQHRFQETWFHSALPEQGFSTYQALRAAVLAAPADQLRAELGRYPRLEPVKKDSCGNACRFCPPSDRAPGQPRVKHDTWLFIVATQWRAAYSACASLCEDHKHLYESDPQGFLQALATDAAQRQQKYQSTMKAIFNALPS